MFTIKGVSMFSVNNIVKKFSNLQKEVEAYLVQQSEAVAKIEEHLEDAKRDKVVAENIKNALDKIVNNQ